MRIQVRYFASIREALGLSGETVETAANTLGQLRAELHARGDAYGDMLAADRAVRMALNQVMAGSDAALSEGAEVAFFPPVTGG